MYMHKHFVLAALLIISQLLHFIPDQGTEFLWLISWASLQGGLLVLYVYLRGPKALTMAEVAPLFLLTRLPLLTSLPILENDFWRYLWDGRVLVSGINPFSHAPIAPELDVVDIWFRNRVGYPDIGTIYPPFSQLMFGLTTLIGGSDIIAFKLMFIFFEGVTFYALWKWLNARRRSADLLWLLFHPLFLKEIVNSAHLDAISVCMAVLFIISLKKSWKSASLFLALAVLSKIWALVLFPVLFFHVPKGRRMISVMTSAGIICLFYLPFLSAGDALWDGTSAFAADWIFNAAFHNLFLMFFPETMSKIIGAALTLFIASFAAWMFPKEKAAVWAVGSLLLFSPVINAWYILWILPFALMARSWSWIFFGVLVFAGYAWFWDEDRAFWFRGPQWILFSLAIIYECWPRNRETSGVLSSPVPERILENG